METMIHLVALSTLMTLQILCFFGGIQEVGGVCSRTFECPTGDSGSNPVCGSDRRTYSSRCTLQLAKCNGHRVRMAYKGSCKGTRPSVPQRSHNLVVTTTTKCLRERQEALSNARAKDLIMLGVFAPKCEADGSFSRVQCLNSSGYCWCVDREGKEMSGTKVRQRTPHCPTIKAHSQPSEKPSGKGWKSVKPCINCKGCPRDARTNFNDKLVKFLSKQFMEYVKKSASSSGQVQGQSSSMGKVHLLLWKFTHLDTNADYMLEMKELHAFLKITKKTIHPKKCSRTFMAYCDRERDHKISLNEWYFCFGVKEIKKCSGEYLAALKASRHSSSENQPYLPRCATDGSFTPTQCHYSIGYCWCVDIDTGKPIPNTTQKATSLDCRKYLSKQNATGLAKKECAQDLWTSFRKQMLRLFRREVGEDSPKHEEDQVESIRNQRRSARSGNLQLFGTFLTDNQVLIWKFNRLDRNRDKLLVSSEFLTSTMKKILGNVKRGRKCGKKLLVDCDLDKDRGLSMMEWTLCLRIHDRRMPLQ